jgi:hypothetical protein
MKFLISNYSTYWNTEPLYFNVGLNSINGVKSSLMNSQQSVYDNFDITNPNVFITHLSEISKDMISYLQDKDIIDNSSAVLASEKLNPIFFGNDDINVENAKYIKILSAADTFLSTGKKEYSIQKLIFVNKLDEIVNLEGTYHYATNNQEISDKVDIFLPIISLNTLFSNYDEIIFKGEDYIGSQVIFDTKDTAGLDKIDSIFKGQKLLSSVKNKHTGLHRLKSLLSQLSYSELSNNLESVINKL